jgi:phosphoribosylaminoimidazole (AIR) synthetase
MVVVIAPGDADRASTLLRSAGETVYRIGTVELRPAGGAATVVR